MLREGAASQPELLELARRLTAYIPVTLTRQIITNGLPAPGEPRALMAATLFSDISGFTAMSEELASDGPRGAEELNRVLLLTFTGMIGVIHDMGGAVSHFYGDAMSVYFPDEDGRAARRALACAQMMQRLMLATYERVVTNRPPGKDPAFHLTIKIGVGYGRCQELVVGTPENSMEFVLTGTAVDDAARAEKHARASQVVASRTVLNQAGLRHAGTPDAAFCLLDTPLPAPDEQPILEWSRYDKAALSRLVDAVKPFIPKAIYRRLTSTGAEGLAEHRPVTSIFVKFDYVGDEDPSSAIETAEMGQQLQQYYQWASSVVARFGGDNARLNRVLTGDKGNQLHIIFGAPVAPDAPDQASRCALTLQQERPPFISTQYVGLAAGKVFAGPVGSSSRQEYTVVGDVVNLSARLMQVCAAGEILTDKTTAERTRNLIKFEQRPTVKLKGKQVAISPYRVLGDRTVTTQLKGYFGRWERPLVNRTREVDLLLGAMDAALNGIGGVAAIFGSTGVGKTRLLATGVKYWLETGGKGLVGVCHQHTADIPFGPWRTIWYDFFNLNADMDAEAQAAAVVAQTQTLVPNAGADVGLWGEMLGLPISQDDSLAELTAEVRQSRLFTLVRRCFRAAAARHPLLLVLENLHWADQSSLALIDELSPYMREWPLFVALTFRALPEKLSLETLNRPLCVPIVVSDLPPEHGRQLIEQLLGTADLPPIAQQHLGLRDRDGRDSPVNPLFLEEALNVMVDVGGLQINDQVRVDETLLTNMQVPDTIHALLLARLDRLPPPNRDLLQVASVVGRQFTLESVDTITPTMPSPRVSKLLFELSEEEITRVLTTKPDWTYLFQHALTHEVAYESLPYARRQILHAAVADWLVERNRENLRPLYPILAYHYSRADIHEEGLRYALAAADDALDIFANEEAVDLYNLAHRHLRVLGEDDHWQTAVDLYLSRGKALLYIGDFTAAMADVERAIRIALSHDDPQRIAKAHNQMAELKYRQAHFDETAALTQKVLTAWADDVSSDELARAYQWLGMAASSLFDYERALSNLQEAEKICLTTNNNNRLARVLEAMAFVHYMKRDLEQALAAMQRSVELSRNFSIPANIASALNNIALIQSTLGRAEEALETYNEAIDLLFDTNRNFLAHFLANRGAVLAYLGRFPEALKDFEEATEHFVAMEDEHGLVEANLLWAYEYSNVRREWQDARQRFEQTQQLIDRRPEDYPEKRIRLLLGYGQVELEAGSLARAAAMLDEAATMIEDKDLAWWRPVAAYFKGLLSLAQNDTAKAKARFEQALSTVEQGGCPDYLPLILLELAQLEAESDKRTIYLRQCVEAAQRRARLLDQIACLKKAGEMLVNETGEALRALGKQALAQAQSLPSSDSTAPS